MKRRDALKNLGLATGFFVVTYCSVHIATFLLTKFTIFCLFVILIFLKTDTKFYFFPKKNILAGQNDQILNGMPIDMY